MNIAQLLKEGKYIKREAWPGITYIFLQGEVIIFSHLGIDHTWAPSHLDILGEDWIEVVPDR